MGKFDKNRRYTLTNDFAYKGKKYKSSSSLVAFYKFQKAQPVDFSHNHISAIYEGTPAIADAYIGSRKVQAATFSDASNINARATSAKFSFSTLASGASASAGSDLPFSISIWVKIDGSGSGNDYFFGKDGNVHEYTGYYQHSTGKIFFWIGASTSSFIAFFTLGYMSKYLSNYLNTKKIWKIINLIIIIIMSILAVYVFLNIIKFFNI